MYIYNYIYMCVCASNYIQIHIIIHVSLWIQSHLLKGSAPPWIHRAGVLRRPDVVLGCSLLKEGTDILYGQRIYHHMPPLNCKEEYMCHAHDIFEQDRISTSCTSVYFLAQRETIAAHNTEWENNFLLEHPSISLRRKSFTGTQ